MSISSKAFPSITTYLVYEKYSNELLCLNIYTLAYKQSTDIADLYIEIIVNPKERLGD
jgi:hypothetical protein